MNRNKLALMKINRLINIMNKKLKLAMMKINRLINLMMNRNKLAMMKINKQKNIIINYQICLIINQMLDNQNKKIDIMNIFNQKNNNYQIQNMEQVNKLIKKIKIKKK